MISGDLIVLINDTPTAKLRHDTAISLLDTQGSALRLAFIRPLPDANAHHAPIIINTPPASDEGALSDTCSTASSVPRYPTLLVHRYFAV